MANWWDAFPEERFWVEITSRDDIGADLHAQSKAGTTVALKAPRLSNHPSRDRTSGRLTSTAFSTSSVAKTDSW